MGTLTTGDRYAVIGAKEVPTVEECTFRMLDTGEVAAGMAFHHTYQVKGNKRQQTMGYGNAVTHPPPKSSLRPRGNRHRPRTITLIWC